MDSIFNKKNLLSVKFFPYVYSLFLLGFSTIFEEHINWSTWRIFLLLSFIISILMHRNYLKLDKLFNKPNMELYKANENIVGSVLFSVLIVFFIILLSLCLIALYSFIRWTIPDISYYSSMYIIPKLLLVSWFLISITYLLRSHKIIKDVKKS